MRISPVLKQILRDRDNQEFINNHDTKALVDLSEALDILDQYQLLLILNKVGFGDVEKYAINLYSKKANIFFVLLSALLTQASDTNPAYSMKYVSGHETELKADNDWLVNLFWESDTYIILSLKGISNFNLEISNPLSSINHFLAILYMYDIADIAEYKWDM